MVTPSFSYVTTLELGSSVSLLCHSCSSWWTSGVRGRQQCLHPVFCAGPSLVGFVGVSEVLTRVFFASEHS